MSEEISELHQLDQKYIETLEKRVEELERGIAESCDDMRFEYAGCKRAEAAEAKLTKVRELPGKWRDEPDHYDWLCADELEAVLNKEQTK